MQTSIFPNLHIIWDKSFDILQLKKIKEDQMFVGPYVSQDCISAEVDLIYEHALQFYF